MKSAVQPNKKSHNKNNPSFGMNNNGYQSERITHKASGLSQQLKETPSLGSFNLGINQTLRNFNTITHELEKINEHIGGVGIILPSTDNIKIPRKVNAASLGVATSKRSIGLTNKDYPLSSKRGPLSNI